MGFVRRLFALIVDCVCCGVPRLQRVGALLPVRVGSLQLLVCWVTLVVLMAQRWSFSLASYPIFDLQYRWNRMDQAVFVGGAFLGGMCTPLLGTLVSRSVSTQRPAAGAALVILGVLNYLFRFSWSSFYEMWVNRALAASVEGFMEGLVCTMLWRWIPAHEFAPAMLLMWSAVGAAMVAAESMAVFTFGGVGNFSAMYLVQALQCLLVGLYWMSPAVDHPDTNVLVRGDERQSVVSLAGFRATSRLRLGEWKDAMSQSLQSITLWRLSLGAAAYGWLLGPFLTFNSAYFLEMVTLRMAVGYLPVKSRYPWLLWAGAAATIAGLLLTMSRQGMSPVVRRRSLLVLEMIGVVMTIVALRSIGDYHSIRTTYTKYCSVVIGAAIASGCFLAKVCEPQGRHFSLPIELPTTITVLLAVGSASAFWSVMLMGNILEMAGSWSIVFTYQTRFLAAYILLEIGVPLLGYALRRLLSKALGDRAIQLV